MEEQVIDIDMELTIAQAMRQVKFKKNNKKKKTQSQPVAADTLPPIFSEDLPEKEVPENDTPAPEIEVSLFDNSVENHFRDMDKIAELCGESELQFDQNELQRLSSSITFLREWKHFNYQPRVIRFACQSENHQGKDVFGEIKLPQFSAAIVPKKVKESGNAVLPESGKDFVMYVGGSVWALDWCPAVHQNAESHAKSEFLAVAAHPPESSYHKIGAPLTGRGLVQIWCLLNDKFNEEYVPSQVHKISTQPQKPKGRPRKRPVSESEDDSKPKKKRGRPRKRPVSESEDDLFIDIEQIDSSLGLIPNMVESGNTHDQVATKYSVRKKKISAQEMSGEPQQTPGNIGIIEIKSPVEKNAGERPKRVTRKKPEDQYLSVQSPELNTSDSKKESKSSRPRIKRGKPKKKSEGKYIEALAIEYPDSTSCPINEVSETIYEQTAKSGSSGEQWDSSRSNTGVLKQNSTNNEKVVSMSAPLKKSKGRPGKRVETECEYVQALDVQSPGNLPSLDKVAGIISEHTAEEESFRKQTGPRLGVINENLASTTSVRRAFKNKDRRRGNDHENSLPALSKEGTSGSIKNQVPSNYGEVGRLNESVTSSGHLKMNPSRCSSCKDVEIPRPVLCLAHNGKVAWDVKWQPSDSFDADSKHRMGYLAVLLGNGALEVWDVPSPHAVKVIYSAMRKDGTDPRFIKLNPVFRCSKLTSGDRQSVPLTVEWSASPPHDLILAGCHDGVVALWKFSANVSSKDTRPLLCFSADTVPIRALAWAPSQSDPESANVIVTAGQGSLKFWDIRDPFHPMWDLNPIQKVICSLDWVPDPRGIIISYEDGTIRILSLSEAANNVPVTGKPFVGTLQEGLHRYCCSSYTIWSIQVSRITGMVAYCSADGTVLRFQLTSKAVGRDPLRHRAPHFLCGSLTEEDSTLTMYTPLPEIPLLMKKPSNQEKRVEEMTGGQTSNQQPLALCYGDDPGIESGSEDMMTGKSKKSSKSKNKSNMMPNTSQAIVCRGDDPEPVQLREGNANENKDKVEVLPPKIIAMHRVRWNMNKGSERWLCYGGASGVVRCQEV
ncbi:putative general transcription factor 3C polypeptide 2-like [Heracleum sosnowskyi]|uniref:General transcription factor 3C polypeptide 2-like n=1 Tax=Heracleum sosnowskyi TaxID=360622 RepID=A0AAD8NCH4_9APIA|nr:putative general transcription factor 3C polypeptide 2-like [Heracleum sosnowskyi]